jgi:hypothetical protein
MQFSPSSYYFLPLGSTYSAQHPVLKHPQSIYSSLNVRDQVSHPYKTPNKIIVLYSLIFKFLDSRRKDSTVLYRFKAYHSSLEAEFIRINNIS